MSKQIETTCKKCQKTFATYACRLRVGKYQFCSRECRKVRSTLSCIVCSKNYEIENWKIKRQKTCSKQCGNELVKRNSAKARLRTCLACSKIFVKDSASKGIFCSRECRWSLSKRKVDYKCIDCGVAVSPAKSVKRCIPCSAKVKTGANHPNWIADRSQIKKSEKKHLDVAYRIWAKSVKDRDCWKCQISNNDCSGRLEAHHILNWVEHPKLRYEVNNGITLCSAHHPRKRKDEERLVTFYQSVVNHKQ